MKIKIAIIGSALIVAIVGIVVANRGPSGYDECIEMNIEKAQTRESALIVNQMCRKRFPKKLLTDAEVFGN